MLNVYITHYRNTTCVEKIAEGDFVVAERNSDTNMIDFDVCLPYIGQEIMVHHTFDTHEKEDYSMGAKLLAIEEDEATGIKSIRYQTRGLRKE